MLSTRWGSGALRALVSPRKVENERGWAVQPSVSRVDMVPVELGGVESFKAGQLTGEGCCNQSLLMRALYKAAEAFYIRQVMGSLCGMMSELMSELMRRLLPRGEGCAGTVATRHHRCSPNTLPLNILHSASSTLKPFHDLDTRP